MITFPAKPLEMRAPRSCRERTVRPPFGYGRGSRWRFASGNWCANDARV
jgi:hypothetical protein